jgi:hypothetical protein
MSARWYGSYLVAAAITLVGLAGTPAQADIIHFQDYLLDSPLGNEANELTFVEAQTGVDLDLFAKKNDDEPTQYFTLESTLTITDPDGKGPATWHVDWTTINWDIRYILVKDGAPGRGDNQQIYTLWEVTPAQFKDGEGDVFLNDFQTKDISHITVFGTRSVPEPATLLLLGIGALGALALRRK